MGVYNFLTGKVVQNICVASLWLGIRLQIVLLRDNFWNLTVIYLVNANGGGGTTKNNEKFPIVILVFTNFNFNELFSLECTLQRKFPNVSHLKNILHDSNYI